MNILQVTLGFYPAQGWGGPVKIVHQNSRELVRRGHRVTVYCTNLLSKKETIQRGTFERQFDGIRVVYFETWHLPQWPGTLGPIWLPGLPGILKRELGHFDIVHLNGYRSLMMLTVAKAARRMGVPIVTQPHGTLPVLVSSFKVKRAYDRVIGSSELRGIGALIALQESERQQALVRGVPTDRIEIIPNGMEAGDQDARPLPGGFRRRWGLDLQRPLILFLARINRIKGTDMLIDAFARLKSRDAQLVIAGPDDGQLAQVRSMIQQYGLEGKVVLPGLLVGPEVMAALADADLFVLPSRSDAYPVAVMEACSMGTPMVVTDRCEIAHLIQDRVAEVVPFDAQAFAAAMDRLLADRDLRDRYRANCPALMNDTFSISIVVDRLEAVYRRLAAEKNRVSRGGWPRVSP